MRITVTRPNPYARCDMKLRISSGLSRVVLNPSNGWVSLTVLVAVIGLESSVLASDLPVVPAPREITSLTGGFSAGPGRPIAISLPAGASRADLAGPLREAIAGWHPGGCVLTGSGAGVIAFGLPAENAAFRERCERLGFRPDAELGDEGYLLHISPGGITAAANAEPGLFYALQTLRQILRATPRGQPLPAVLVRDWPEFAFRGVMDDISRGPLPSREFMREQIRRLAELKINRLTWYIEDVVRVPAHPDFAPPGAIPLAEFRELAEFAAAHHVELVGGFQTLGHFEKILQHPRYAPLGATHRMLEPAEPRVLDFLREVTDEMLQVFPSGLFSLNGDEAFDLAEVSARRGDTPAGVYAAHFTPLIGFVEQRGRKALLWGDMMLAHPALLETMPRSLVIGTWNYDAETDFAAQIIPFRERGYEVIVCPGVLNSNRLSPDYRETRANIRGFAAAGREHGAMGVLNTVWDDGGMHFFARDWFGVAYGAERSWNPSADVDADAGFARRYGLARSGEGSAALGRFLEAWDGLGRLFPTWDMDNWFRHVRLVPKAGETLEINLEGWREVQEVLARVRPLLAEIQADADAPFWNWTVEELAFHADLRFALARWGAGGVDPAEFDGLIARQERLRDELRRLWFLENRDHYTDTALEPDDTRLEGLRELSQRIGQSGSGTRPVEGQFFTYWLLTGPLDVRAGTASLSEIPDLLMTMGGEGKAVPAPGTRFKDVSGTIQRWEKHASELDACLDLEHRRGAGVVYAYATISASAAGPVAACIRQSGEMRVFVNGMPVTAPDSGDWSLPLRAGRNSILLKLLTPPAGTPWQVAVSLPGVEVRHRKHRYSILDQSLR